MAPFFDVKLDSVYRQAYSLVSAEPEQKEWYEELEESVCSTCPKMSLQQRIMGCLVCMGTGFLISMGSTLRLVRLLEGHPEDFAVMYTLGNVLGLCSTCFLYGPLSQAKQMFASTRLAASLIYLTLMGTTLFLAFYPAYVPGRLALLVLSIVLQFLALTWYTLSFIPFARDLVAACLTRSCGCDSCSGSTQDRTMVSAVPMIIIPYDCPLFLSSPPPLFLERLMEPSVSVCAHHIDGGRMRGEGWEVSNSALLET
ncbi:hypothetical protein EON64_02850 [archaeon]|nr:MAG: hypothetical protein EON64_02850 [archaeon]